MIYSKEIIDKILNYTSINNKGKIDRMLEIDANQYCNLGIDSTKTEKQEVWKNSRYIYKAIQKIDNEIGSRFLMYQDNK
tara:strand:+ start:279 stop:515 length:237 start_codon:yes stop_codon:yes gene_type:complete